MPDRSYLLRGLNDSAVAGYYKLMIESAVILGANRTTAEEEMLQTLKFETTLANVSFLCELSPNLLSLMSPKLNTNVCFLYLFKYSLPREERRNISLLYNKMNISEVTRLAPKVLTL